MFVMVSFPYILSHSDNSFRGDTSTELAALLIQSGISKIAQVTIICMVFLNMIVMPNLFVQTLMFVLFKKSARLTP